ncbi:hypothetical protein ACFU7Z_10685 [Kitasatospora sp. NPDC057518]|uniref:hypothetical protein n=1 Tax=Kitasatospora sp. NPDC057518 TaxID=3346155 RepID=UPI00368A40AC
MEVAKLVLEYVQALVWPLFVLILMIFFRGEFKALLRRMKSAKGAGLEAEFGDEFERAEAVSRDAVEEEAAALAEAADGSRGESPGEPQSRPVPRPANPEPGAADAYRQGLDHVGAGRPAEPSTVEGILFDMALRANPTAPQRISRNLGPLVREHPEAAILSGWREVEMEINRVFDSVKRRGEVVPLSREARRTFPVRHKVDELRMIGLGVNSTESIKELAKLRNLVAHGGAPSIVDASDYLAACDNAVWALKLFAASHGVHIRADSSPEN